MVNICFFFQAEDGIRDKLVTGVQTCALPISIMNDDLGFIEALRPLDEPQVVIHDRTESLAVPNRCIRRTGQVRSEERRVGKECRYWWCPGHYKKIVRPAIVAPRSLRHIPGER